MIPGKVVSEWLIGSKRKANNVRKVKRKKIIGIPSENNTRSHFFVSLLPLRPHQGPLAKSGPACAAPDAWPGSALAGERMDGLRMASCRDLGYGPCLDTGGGLWLGRSRGNIARKRPAAYHLVCGLLAS